MQKYEGVETTAVQNFPVNDPHRLPTPPGTGTAYYFYPCYYPQPTSSTVPVHSSRNAQRLKIYLTYCIHIKVLLRFSRWYCLVWTLVALFRTAFFGIIWTVIFGIFIFHCLSF